MKFSLCRATLRRENRIFAGTAGVSPANRPHGFRPAFHDSHTGRTAIARFADGRPAPCHVLDGVPGEWVALRGPAGEVRRLKQTVVAGFVRAGRFYTRAQAAQTLVP